MRRVPTRRRPVLPGRTLMLALAPQRSAVGGRAGEQLPTAAHLFSSPRPPRSCNPCMLIVERSNVERCTLEREPGAVLACRSSDLRVDVQSGAPASARLPLLPLRGTSTGRACVYRRTVCACEENRAASGGAGGEAIRGAWAWAWASRAASRDQGSPRRRRRRAYADPCDTSSGGWSIGRMQCVNHPVHPCCPALRLLSNRV